MDAPKRKLGFWLFWDRYMLAVVFLWTTILAVICIQVYRSPWSRSVTGVYHWADHAWFAQQPLQEGCGAWVLSRQRRSHCAALFLLNRQGMFTPNPSSRFGISMKSPKPLKTVSLILTRSCAQFALAGRDG